VAILSLVKESLGREKRENVLIGVPGIRPGPGPPTQQLGLGAGLGWGVEANHQIADAGATGRGLVVSRKWT